jgi:aminoglycoside 3-N-acetyltransferase I
MSPPARGNAGAAGEAARHASPGSGTAGFQVRLLGPKDVPAARGMLRVFAQAFADDESYLRRQPDDHYLQRLLASDTFVAIVAEADGEVVGALSGYVLPKFEQARAEFYIYDLAVAAAWRRKGVATALIERLKRLAAARGIHVIFVQADQGDDAAIALYTRLGRREDVLHFDIAPAA